MIKNENYAIREEISDCIILFILETVGKKLHFHFKLNSYRPPRNYPNNAKSVKTGMAPGTWDNCQALSHRESAAWGLGQRRRGEVSGGEGGEPSPAQSGPTRPSVGAPLTSGAAWVQGTDPRPWTHAAAGLGAQSPALMLWGGCESICTLAARAPAAWKHHLLSGGCAMDTGTCFPSSLVSS